VGIKERLRHLEEQAQGEMIIVPQQDGTVARFPKSEGIEAFLNWFDRLDAGDVAPPEHPMIAAVRNSSDHEWQRSVYNVRGPQRAHQAHSGPLRALASL
jgi:hypothetical protein